MEQNKYTVLIIGAGASTELGIPGGKSFLMEMASRLCTSLNVDENGNFKSNEGKYHDMINQFLKFREVPMKPETYNTFAPREAYWINAINAFKGAFQKYVEENSSGTIDYFLQNEENDAYRIIGKFALAYHLVGAEDMVMRNCSYCLKPNWIRVFIEKNIDSIYKNDSQNFKVITFNYDRIIEHYIYLYLTQKLGISNKNAKDFINNRLEIIHVYDKIGNLEWQNNVSQIRFGERNDNSTFINYTIKNVKLIGTRITKETQEKITAFIKKATKIYFLGFGFDDENMKILNIPSDKEVIATTFRLSEERVSKIIKKYCLKSFTAHDKRCVDFVSSEVFTII